MKKSTITAARLITEDMQRGGVRYKSVFQVLTYADIDGWSPKHISRYLDAVKKWLARRGCPSPTVWTAELQQRGAVHYNVIWWLPKGVTLPKPDKCGWWPHGSTRSVWARNPVGYIAKYASKIEQKGGDFPRGLRLHGCSGLNIDARRELRWWKFPMWLRDQVKVDSMIKRRSTGGGWVDVETGEFFESPYVVRFSGGHVFLSLKPERGKPHEIDTS